MPMISKKSEEEKAALRFSKKVVITMLVSVGVFTVTMIITYFVTGDVPNTLITEFFGFFKLEGGALGLISVAKALYNFLINKKAKNKNNADPTPGGDNWRGT